MQIEESPTTFHEVRYRTLLIRRHPDELLAGSLVRPGNGGGAAGGIGSLTGREREVLAEIAKGRSNREIARALTVSEKTVKAHVSAVLAKLGVQDRTQAALLAVRNEHGG